MQMLLRALTTRGMRERLSRTLRAIAERLEPRPEQTEMLESYMLFNNWLP